ncbi:MAG: hypothetical protein ACREHG_05980 [Candidatus Saccharimonadales bacterium]
MWAKIWLGWLIFVFASFGILEGWGLSITPKDTLSDTTWSWFDVVAGQGIDHWTLPHLLAVVVLLVIALVLVLHLGLGWFR